MDLGERLHLRDVLLGDDERRGEIDRLIGSKTADPATLALIADVKPLLKQLEAAVEKYLPLGTPQEAVEYALARATGFSVDAVVEYCGGSEFAGGDPVDEVRRLLADEVAGGRLKVEYFFNCPSCKNVIDGRDELPTAPFEVFCEHHCRADRLIDPVAAHSVFMNTNDSPTLESWI